MLPLTEAIWRMDPPAGVFDNAVVRNLRPDRSPGARRVLLHRAMQAGEVQPLKPGLYLLAPPFQREPPHPFILAAILQSPSYVSLESALWHHGWIPEALFQVASVGGRRSRTFTTPQGVFSYACVPCHWLKAGTRAERFGRNWAFVARPLRAIADLVYLRGWDWRREGAAALTESLRIEQGDLRSIPAEDYMEVASTFKNRRTLQWLNGMQKEFWR